MTAPPISMLPYTQSFVKCYVANLDFVLMTTRAIDNEKNSNIILREKGGENLELLKNIVTAINNSRKTRGQVARELDVTYNYLWRLLAGKSAMKADMVARIAISLESTPNELYGIRTD